MILYCTFPDESSAADVAKILVQEKLCACVNRIPGIVSSYIYNGEYCEDREILLLIKADPANYDALEERIKALHPYETPEIIAVSISRGSDEYLSWMRENSHL